jgi:hypothetical protein
MGDCVVALRRRAQAHPKRGQTCPSRPFLARHDLPPSSKTLARMMVEGYHAAPVDQMSAQALAAGDEETREGSHRQHRIVGGYDRLLGWLRAGLDPARVSVRLRTAVTEVRWDPADVRVRARVGTGSMETTFRAAAVVVSVPLGVLKAPPDAPGGLRFVPEVERHRSVLAGLEMGPRGQGPLPVPRADLEQRRGLLPRRRRRLPDLVDARSPARARAHGLGGWTGGPGPARPPRARGRGRGPAHALLDARSAAAALEQLLEGWAWHDWQADPLSRARIPTCAWAASHHRARWRGRSRARSSSRARLPEPEEMGTVSAAIASGRRAARQVETVPAVAAPEMNVSPA